MAPRKKGKIVNKAALGQNPPNQSNSAKTHPEVQTTPIELQQRVLDVFRHAFPLDDQADVKAIIQEVKGHLFLRDFARAFAKQQYLEAYAFRWSASRALGYLDILRRGDLQHIWVGETSSRPDPAPDPRLTRSACRVACIGGGGGAEVAALAAAASSFSSAPKMEIHAIDIADWSSCVGKLGSALTTPPQLSAYASASAKAANKPLMSAGRLQVFFSQHDILHVEEDLLRDLVGGVHLCTIMFTLNELFTNSIARTTAFLLALTDTMALGSWFLVVDSPGSYSEVKLGQGENAKTKQYPMKWLLDHTLLEVAAGENSKWKKHVSDDSRWFRLNPSLNYPIDLENMRYQIHLYQRIDSEGT